MTDAVRHERLGDNGARWPVRWILVLATGVILACVCWHAWPSHDQGDGLEYLAMSEALLSHGTPDIRKSDIQTILDHNVGAATDVNTTKISDEWLQQMRLEEPRGIGIYRSESGLFYSYHFWLYPLINVPALAIVQARGLPLYASLLVTNCVLLWGLAALIIFAPPWRVRRVMLLVALVLAGGSTFYLGWTGPEVMCFVFLLGGLVLLEMRRFAWALLAFAVAAQQNPPIGLLAVAAGTCGCWRAWQRWRDTQSFSAAGRQLASLVPGALVLIASPLFYWIEFGTPNLIVAAGFTDASLISGIRLASVFFDLNQGMILAIPGAFLVVLVLLLLLGVRRRSSAFWGTVGLLLAAVVMAVPVLSALNWNSGDVVVTRYAYWLSAPVIYASALLADSMGWWTFTVATCILAASQSVVLTGFGLLGNKDFYLADNRVAVWVFDNHPSWYRPVPEIFAERAVHREGVLNDGTLFFYVHHGHASIILAPMRQASALSAICDVRPRETDRALSEQGWEYFYPGDGCQVPLQDGFYSIPVPPPGWSGGSIARILERRGQAGAINYYHASLSQVGRPTVSADGKRIVLTVDVTNDGVAPFGSATSPHTVNLGAHSVDATGNIVTNDLARAALPSIVLPGTSTTVSILLPITTALGYRVELLPVQEGVAWFDQWGTKPLVVGPFEACASSSKGDACDASGKPLANTSTAQ